MPDFRHVSMTKAGSKMAKNITLSDSGFPTTLPLEGKISGLIHQARDAVEGDIPESLFWSIAIDALNELNAAHAAGEVRHNIEHDSFNIDFEHSSFGNYPKVYLKFPPLPLPENSPDSCDSDDTGYYELEAELDDDELEYEFACQELGNAASEDDESSNDETSKKDSDKEEIDPGEAERAKQQQIACAKRIQIEQLRASLQLLSHQHLVEFACDCCSPAHVYTGIEFSPTGAALRQDLQDKLGHWGLDEETIMQQTLEQLVPRIAELRASLYQPLPEAALRPVEP